MLATYRIGATGIAKCQTMTEANWLVLSGGAEQEKQDLIEKYQLPADIFIGADQAEEVSRLEKIGGSKLTNAYSLVLLDLSAETQETIEKRIQPVSLIVAKEFLITYFPTESDLLPSFLEKHQQDSTSVEKLIGYLILTIYGHFISELLELKQRIDQLDKAARETTENSELFSLADTERRVVYLDHTLQDQAETLDQIWEWDSFLQGVDDEELLFDIRLRQRQANKLIVLYRDLLETIGGLFTDMMDNNLNHLMKYLDSAALVIAIPALITGIWGMNTGGLPGKGSNLGFFIVVGIACVLALLAWFHLRRKDYSK